MFIWHLQIFSPPEASSSMADKNCNHTRELFALLIYGILLAIVSYFHEPWFDESQAWLISRDSNLLSMVWNVMRYEGHTPLWHLLLFIPAHFGVPFEIGLKLINFCIISAACWIFLRYSPFPLFFRMSTPFTYFLFYQYGVISRCYSLLVLMLWIIAASFPKRNSRPFLFSFLLMILGGVSAYGMLIAFGIALAWLIEIITSYQNRSASWLASLRHLFSERRFHALIFLGLINLGYLAILWPRPDRLTPPIDYHVTAVERLYRLLVVPVGALFLSEASDLLPPLRISLFFLFVTLAGFLIVAALVVWASNNKKMFCYLVFPNFVLTLFMTFIYFGLHHTGIYTLLIIFAFWISYEHSEGFSIFLMANWIPVQINLVSKYRTVFRRISVAALVCILSIQIYWTFTAAINDMRFPYAPYKDIASFIRKHSLDKYKIFDYYHLSNQRNTFFANDLALLSYFPHNLFYNHNFGDPNISFAQHRKIDDRLLYDYLRKAGKPDFILWHRDSLPFYKDLFSLSDYVAIKGFSGFYMWKDTLNSDEIVIFARRDLLPQLPGIGLY
jgi:hypothetical protein